MKKTIQMFDVEKLAVSRKLSPDQVVRWLDDYRLMMLGPKKIKSKLISIKVPEDLLELFRSKAAANDVPYQTKIKILMTEWLKSS